MESRLVVVLRRSSDPRNTPRKPREVRRSKNVSFARDVAGHGAKSSLRKQAGPFVLYVEGPRDREILSCWARRIDHELARAIEGHTMILGGRRPARALSDFRKRGGGGGGVKGLVVLDRDDHPGSDDLTATIGNGSMMLEEEGLDVFIWSRRHIESYLIVPAALRRLLGLDPGDRRIERFVEEQEHGPDLLDAKRILGPGGSLSEALGADLHAGEIARAMRSEEFHADILELFDRIGRALGLAAGGPEVVIRRHTKA